MLKSRYIMMFVGLMSLSFYTAYAQRITRSFRNTSMSEVLTVLAKSTKDYHINFIYDELEDFTVTTNIVKRTAPDAIRQIIGFYPMKMTIDGDNIFVECTQKSSTKMIGRVVDSNNRPIDFANVALLN
ncbi:MAG: TonB-dependent receptor, partial [Prevotella sp.]|nr:TonB-dependent receptor [Prevotella sp.]